jgi:hypothetical protein
MPISTFPHTDGIEVARTLGPRMRHWLFSLILAAILSIAGYEAYFGLQPSGMVIRHDLVRAGVEVARLPWSTPIERVQQAVSRRFARYRASVDASRFPDSVTVTLLDLGRADCRAAHLAATRIEGQVVIAMERPLETSCQDRTSITWRIMP